MTRAADAVRAVKGGYSGDYAAPPGRTNMRLYGDDNPLGGPTFETKVRLLEAIDAYARAKDPRVRQVSVSLRRQLAGGSRSCAPTARLIATSGRWCASTCRSWPGQATARKPAASAPAAATAIDRFLEPALAGAVDEALRQALVNLEAVPAPAGEMPVVLGPGWPGVMLHEAVGHGLEGDFNRKEHLRVRRPDRPAGRRARRHGRRRRHASRSGAARSPSTTKARRPTAPC